MKKIVPVVLLLLSGHAFCQSGFRLRVSGEVPDPLELSLTDLSMMVHRGTEALFGPRHLRPH